MYHPFHGRYGYQVFGNTTGDRTGYRTGDRRSRHDGGDRSGFRHAHCPMGRAGRIVSCGAAAGRDDVFDGFGFGFLHPAKQETGAEREPAPSAGAGERFERPDGVRADHCADRRIVRRCGGRERTDEYREIRDPDASRRFDGVCYRSDRRMDH